MAERRDEHAIRVPRIDDQRADLPRIAQPEMRPGPAGVGGLVDAVADRQIRTLKSFAAADVDDVRIGRRDRDGANRLRRLPVEDRCPRPAVIVRFPDTAVVDADVEDVRLLRHSGRADRPSATERSDMPPLQIERRIAVE